MPQIVAYYSKIGKILKICTSVGFDASLNSMRTFLKDFSPKIVENRFL